MLRTEHLDPTGCTLKGHPMLAAPGRPSLAQMPETLDDLLLSIVSQQTQSRQHATFVQLGANDGQMNDPLYRHMLTHNASWLGILVEPQPKLFGSLVHLHKESYLWTFYNGAIGGRQCNNGTLFFCVSLSQGEGSWTTQGQIGQISWTHRDNSKRCPPGHTPQQMPCLKSVNELVQKHASTQFILQSRVCDVESSQIDHCFHAIDLLQLDVEGSELRVLQQLDWDIISPLCIHFEHAHLGSDNKPLMDLLKTQGYQLKKMARGGRKPMDTLACRITTPRD